MILQHKEHSAKSEPGLIEWQICEDDREWETVQTHPAADSRPAARTRQWLKPRAWAWSLPVLLVLAVLAGWWVGHLGQMGLDEIETELQTAVDAGAWAPLPEPVAQGPGAADGFAAEKAREAVALRAMAEPGELVSEVQIVDLGRDWAVLQVTLRLADGATSLHQTQVYRQTPFGWERIAPTAAHWGRPRRLESHHFVFQHFARDAAAVEEAADRLDTLYETLHAIFFLNESSGNEKLVVHVNPEQMPGQLPQESASQADLVVASPAATLAPSEIAPSDLLVQSLALALFDKLAGRATQRYDLPRHWLPLRDGLRLWFIWNEDLSLAVWREPLVGWVLGGSQARVADDGTSVPDFGHDLCAHHRLWTRTPLEVAVPVTCVQQANATERITAWRYPYLPPLEEPLPLPGDVPLSGKETGLWRGRLRLSPLATPVVLATVVDYAAATFGAGRLPVLLIALPNHDSWETLIPAVFGASFDEFEAGWRAFLNHRHGISQ